MKKLMNNYRLWAVAAVMVGIGFATSAKAMVGANKSPLEFTWIGNHNESPIFKLALNNAAAAEYYIVIKDEDNQVLYAEKLKGANITRLYQLQNQSAEIEDAKITFEITDRSTNATVVYKVSTLVQLQSSTVINIKK